MTMEISTASSEPRN